MKGILMVSVVVRFNFLLEWWFCGEVFEKHSGSVGTYIQYLGKAVVSGGANNR